VDIYWRIEPCDFVMRKLEREQNCSGTPVITEPGPCGDRHPLAYPATRGRSCGIFSFFCGSNLTMLGSPMSSILANVFPDRRLSRAGLAARQAQADACFRTGSWLLLVYRGVRVWLAATENAGGRFAIGVCGSARSMC